MSTSADIDRDLDFIQGKLTDVCPSCAEKDGNHRSRCVRNITTVFFDTKIRYYPPEKTLRVQYGNCRPIKYNASYVDYTVINDTVRYLKRKDVPLKGMKIVW